MDIGMLLAQIWSQSSGDQTVDTPVWFQDDDGGFWAVEDVKLEDGRLILRGPAR